MKIFSSLYGLLILFSLTQAQEFNIQWQRSLGGSDRESNFSFTQTKDGGSALVGFTFSNDGDMSCNVISSGHWMVKLDAEGNIQWQKCLRANGLNFSDLRIYIQQTSDDGYILGGATSIPNYTPQGYYIDKDFLIVKIDSLGNPQWQYSFRDTNYNELNSIQQTSDGGFIVTGNTHQERDYYDTTGHIYDGFVSYTSSDCIVLKLDAFGNLQWEKLIGGSDMDFPISIQQTPDEGYILGGLASSSDGDASGCSGG